MEQHGVSFKMWQLKNPDLLNAERLIGSAMKVVGTVVATEDQTQTFELSSTKHAVGYPKLQPRYYCGSKNCSYSAAKWDDMVHHIAKAHSAACQQLKSTD
jgi:hypothetical protein